MRNTNAILAISAVFVVIFFIAELFFAPTTYIANRVGRALASPAVFFHSLIVRQNLVKENARLGLENQSLQAQLAELKSRPLLIKGDTSRYVLANIYSTYPFNTANQMAVDAGDEEGVAKDAAVLVTQDIFFGQLTTVESHRSVVRTIFDPGWELPVRIGKNRVDALLVGGREPKLTLISKNKTVEAGEEVYLVSRDFPFGLTIGSTAAVTQSQESLFQEAKLVLPYQVSSLTNVLILVR